MNIDAPMLNMVTASLDGALYRHQLSALNVANVNTPDYRVRGMDFYAYVQAVQEHAGNERAVAPKDYVALQAGPVKLEDEMTQMAQNVLYYESLLAGWEKYVGTLRLAINDGKG